MILLTGPAVNKYNRESAVASDLNKAAKALALKDANLWGEGAKAEAGVRLNWIDLPRSSRDLLPELDALSAWARANGLNNFILCGMGGSSLAPEVMAKTFNREITILDTTDPTQIRAAVPQDLRQTLIIVGSKSGSTIETASQKAFFEKLFTDAGLDPVSHFVIVTDPKSPLDISSRASGYKVINADPNVGGRFSALSAFGLVPAALLGIDVSVLLDDADVASSTFTEEDSPAIKLATLLFEQCEQNFSLTDENSNVSGLGDWIEQLIAESTGKDQRGRLPIVIESAKSEVSGLALRIGFAQDSADLNVIATLGEHFILWEWVTALLCRALEVDPFNQPNVTEAKERTGELLAQWASNGIPKNEAKIKSDNLEIFFEGSATNFADALKSLITPASKYLAVMAYLNRTADFPILGIRSLLASKTRIGTTFGWGPRFLHSTGQFHKGGTPNGIFIQITGDSKEDLAIPGKDFTFQRLLMAQALGDALAIESRNFPLMRIHLLNREAGIAELLDLIAKL